MQHPDGTGTGLAGYGLGFGAYCREMASWSSTEDIGAAGRAALPGFPDEVPRLIMVPGRLFTECAAWGVGSVALTGDTCRAPLTAAHGRCTRQAAKAARRSAVVRIVATSVRMPDSHPPRKVPGQSVGPQSRCPAMAGMVRRAPLTGFR